MSRRDRTRWERKHEARRTAAARPTIDWIPPPPDGRGLALDVACGQGRNCSALLASGYDVVGVDIARNALTHAVARCAGSASRFDAMQADLDCWPFAEAVFDVIVQIDFLSRELFPALRRSTRPGGLVLVDTFRLAATPPADGPRNPSYLLRDDELQQAFAGWQILRAAESDSPSPRAAILARRPADAGAGIL